MSGAPSSRSVQGDPGLDETRCTGYGRYSVRCRRPVPASAGRALCFHHEHQRAYLDPVDPLARRKALDPVRLSPAERDALVRGLDQLLDPEAGQQVAT